VAYSGAGLNLRTGKPTARAVCQAVRKLLSDDTLRVRARELSAEYARYDSLALALSHVERLL
jgi:UDP:flavonoid glycosyltransferase YjiC (YdhE family)